MKSGWFKMYWEFLDNLTPESALLLSYLIDVEPMMKNKDGDYFRLSNSFIQERFQTWSEYVIKTHLQELLDKGYIEMQQKFGVEFKRGCLTRWVKIKYNPENNPEDKHEDNPNNNPEKFELNNTNNINKIDNNNELLCSSGSSSNNNSPDKSFCEESTDSYIATPQAQEPIWVQDKAIESYVLNLTSIDKETKDYLLGWVQQNLNSKCLTVAKLRIILKDLYAQCNNDISLVSESIKNSYLKNWKNFYVPDSIEKQQHIEKPVEQQKQEECEVITDLNAWLNS